MNARKKRVPTVSVCIPTDNRAQLLGRAIDSILRQDYKHFELMICDDASTDNTEEIVKKYKDTRIQCVRNNINVGLWGVAMDA